ncbi:MAG: hypothetical protein ACD_39C01668G0001, partial [uncultured bacterium]
RARLSFPVTTSVRFKTIEKEKMKAYKFKGPDQFAYALDIIFNNRLFCADWSDLNDPMEGVFAYSHRGSSKKNVKKIVGEVINEKQKLKVCSLSETFDCHLLWAHYASGFKGLAIEVELPQMSKAIKRIKYGPLFNNLNCEEEFAPSSAAKKILTYKYQEWAYEKEIRILQRGKFFPLKQPVSHVIAGHRMEPALFKALNYICTIKGIRLSRTGIGDEGIDADYVAPPQDISNILTKHI